MKFRRKYTITLLITFMIFFLSANIYFVQVLFDDRRVDSDESTNSERKKNYEPLVKKPRNEIKAATIYAAERIKEISNKLSPKYFKRQKDFDPILKQLVDDLNETVPLSSALFSVADKWATPVQLVPSPAPTLGSLLRSLCKSRILKAEISAKGSQLKLLLTLEGGNQGIFKPQWYERSKINWGPPYGGKDRHNGEVAAFHLSLLLGLPRVPITVGRRLHLPLEIIPVANEVLLKTFVSNGSATCFYGLCRYCSPEEPVCGKTFDRLDGGPYLEGALSLRLPTKLLPLHGHRNPWQRTYVSGRPARWEVNKDYCLQILEGQHTIPGKLFSGNSINVRNRLLELIDAAIFDFLIGNADRHHVETFKFYPDSKVLLIDNGKSFGNPYEDYLDILAPLYQCCIVRQKTWERLLLLSGGTLGEALERLLRPSHLAPLLNPTHYVALNRRLIHVYAAVEMCLENKTMDSVIIDS